MAEIVPADPAGIRAAARRLHAGEIVAFPTETVYGLGADTFNPAALDRIYAIKGRPADNPLIAHVLDMRQAWGIVARWDSRCQRLVRRFWPGPLTLVLPRADGVPARATAGLPTIAVRAPDHPVARALLAAFQGVISAPSANRSGRVSPTTAAHVSEDFADERFMILDGGPCRVGIESTVVDMTTSPPRVLRHGGVTLEELQETIGDVDAPPVDSQGASPGTAPRHYAPRARVEVVEAPRLGERLAGLARPSAVLCFDATRVPPPHRPIVMPRDDRAYAARLYDALREADAMGGERIVIERPPERGDLWEAIHDRLRRAANR
jgi:L-threonylcarbamoyladenylate synthase